MRKMVATNFGKKCSMLRTIAAILIVAIILSADLLTSAESPEFVLRDTRQSETVQKQSSYLYYTNDNLAVHLYNAIVRSARNFVHNFGDDKCFYDRHVVVV